jgi:hypothetical protein
MDAPVAATTISRRDLLTLGGAAVAAVPLISAGPAQVQAPNRGGVFRSVAVG